MMVPALSGLSSVSAEGDGLGWDEDGFASILASMQAATPAAGHVAHGEAAAVETGSPHRHDPLDQVASRASMRSEPLDASPVRAAVGPAGALTAGEEHTVERPDSPLSPPPAPEDLAARGTVDPERRSMLDHHVPRPSLPDEPAVLSAAESGIGAGGTAPGTAHQTDTPRRAGPVASREVPYGAVDGPSQPVTPTPSPEMSELGGNRGVGSTPPHRSDSPSEPPAAPGDLASGEIPHAQEQTEVVEQPFAVDFSPRPTKAHTAPTPEASTVPASGPDEIEALGETQPGDQVESLREVLEWLEGIGLEATPAEMRVEIPEGDGELVLRVAMVDGRVEVDLAGSEGSAPERWLEDLRRELDARGFDFAENRRSRGGDHPDRDPGSQGTSAPWHGRPARPGILL